MATSQGPSLPSLAGLAQRVGAALKERKEPIAVVESSSGGLVSAALLAVPGASNFESERPTRCGCEGLRQGLPKPLSPDAALRY
ncbi:MAG: hypothetical protein EOP82_03150 [Variovorax sp.]|nr:MAG: hypothetical protein EOP82_03150 [Variovorax sp.]